MLAIMLVVVLIQMRSETGKKGHRQQQNLRSLLQDNCQLMPVLTSNDAVQAGVYGQILDLHPPLRVPVIFFWERKEKQGENDKTIKAVVERKGKEKPMEGLFHGR